MCRLPKLKINFGYREETYELGEAKYIFRYGTTPRILVEGKQVNSYEELTQLVTQDCYKNKEFLEVKVTPFLVAGG